MEVGFPITPITNLLTYPICPYSPTQLSFRTVQRFQEQQYEDQRERDQVSDDDRWRVQDKAINQPKTNSAAESQEHGPRKITAALRHPGFVHLRQERERR